MSLKRSVHDTAVAAGKRDRGLSSAPSRRIVMTFEVETHLYPAEICEPTRLALELAGISVLKCSAEWAK